jgi:hypothetical protein
MSADLTDEEKEIEIGKWVIEQCEALLNEAGGQLKAPFMCLSSSDFSKLLNIVRQSFEMKAFVLKQDH